ncbi:MAG TPA: hypothetical protein VEB65_05140, partial [Solirubrobacterales bacterium]|nr:hypothetical protein [Solirubrobacterales bacterium]
MHHSATSHPAADAALDRLRALAAAGLTLLALALVAAPSAGAAGCANEAFRSQSPQLADCRAYEMVSPVDMNGNGIEQAFAIGADGNGVVYGTLNAFGDAQSSIAAKWVARRGAGGWSQASLNPLTGGRVPSAYDEPVVMAAAGDLSQILIGSRYPFDPFDQAPYLNFVKPGNGDVYRVHPGGASEWISHGSLLPDPTGLDRALGGASADLSRVFFETKEPLTSEASASTEVNLYESNRGALRSVNVDATGNLIPGGAGIGRGRGAGAAFYPGEFSGGNVYQGHPVDASAVSADGRVVFFTAPLEPTTTQPQLYASVDGATVLASRCRVGACAGEPAPSGALFVVAPEDGSAAIFYSPDQLTAGAPVGGGIYRFDLASGGLAFLTAVGIGDASNHGGVLAASADGSQLYLCENGEGVSHYHLATGTLTQIAAVPCDAGAAERDPEPSAFRAGTELPGPTSLKQGEPHVTPTAGYLFVTTEGGKIDGYESGGHSQVYLYEPGWPAPRCISCRPDGAPAAGDALLNEEAVARGSSGFTPTPVSSGVAVRNLTADGSRAFFVSSEPLVPADVNGNQ